jgi:hypothetical protein
MSRATSNGQDGVRDPEFQPLQSPWICGQRQAKAMQRLTIVAFDA